MRTLVLFAFVSLWLWASSSGGERHEPRELSGEYKELDKRCAASLNIITTVLNGERANRTNLFKITPEIKHFLDADVRVNLEPIAKRYVQSRSEYLRHGSPADLEAMRGAVRRLTAISVAAQNIINTNLTSKGY